MLRLFGEDQQRTEVTGRRRDRVFAYTAYLNLLSQGTEPLQAEQASSQRQGL